MLVPLRCVFWPGHFTQVVWKGSTELGVGMATNGKKVYVVGQYRPAGNINTKEYFEKNVGQLGNFSVHFDPRALIFHVLLCYNHVYHNVLEYVFLQTPVGGEAAELNFKVALFLF